MATYFGDPEQERLYREWKEQFQTQTVDNVTLETGDAVHIDLHSTEENGIYTVTDSDCDTSINVEDSADNDVILLHGAEPDGSITFSNNYEEIGSIGGDGGDLVLAAGEGRNGGRDGELRLSVGGREISLSNLLDMMQSLGYGHLINDKNEEVKEPKEVPCDFDGAKSVL